MTAVGAAHPAAVRGWDPRDTVRVTGNSNLETMLRKVGMKKTWRALFQLSSCGTERGRQRSVTQDGVWADNAEIKAPRPLEGVNSVGVL